MHQLARPVGRGAEQMFGHEVAQPRLIVALGRRRLGHGLGPRVGNRQHDVGSGRSHRLWPATLRLEQILAIADQPDHLRSEENARRIYDIVCDMTLDMMLQVVLIAEPRHEVHAPKGPRVRLGTWPLPNVWLGVSVEDQTRADERIPILLDTPAAIRFISAEPLLGPIDLTSLDDGMKDGVRLTFDALTGLAYDGHDTIYGIFGQPDPRIDWVIAGGESGSSARPSHPDWFCWMRDQCAEADVAFFFKQWGNWAPDTGPMPSGDPIMDGRARCAVWQGDRWHFAPNGYTPTSDAGEGEWVYHLGKKAAGRMLDGQEHSAFPDIRPDTGGART